MRTDHPKEDPLVELGYEIRDVNYRALGKAILYFFVFAAISFGFGMWYYGKANPDVNRRTVANINQLKRPMPASPNPILQQNVNSKTDLMRMRDDEDTRLHGTGAIEGTDKVHIPIERAMDLLVERGLPKTGADVPAVSTGNTTDGPKTATTPERPAPDLATPRTSPNQPPVEQSPVDPDAGHGTGH